MGMASEISLKGSILEYLSMALSLFRKGLSFLFCLIHNITHVPTFRTTLTKLFSVLFLGGSFHDIH